MIHIIWGIIIIYCIWWANKDTEEKKSKNQDKIDIEGMLSLFNTFEIIFEHINYKYDDIGESSDKYRITEQNINSLIFGVSFDL